MEKDYFSHKAADFDKLKRRRDNVNNIAKAIMGQVSLHEKMHLMDFGSGTGLLLERIAPEVRKITAIDVSPSMNQQLQQKAKDLPCELDILPVDLTTVTPDQHFDGIISSMTLHHIQHTDQIFETLYKMLKSGGFIALADLDSEDGTFHKEDTGVFHNGFDRKWLAGAASKAGFTQPHTVDASRMVKNGTEYSIFLLTAQNE